MKREAMTHTKMKRLCRRLNLPLWQAVGLLESLWHLTARETPRGNIGKLSDEDIALAIDYRGDECEMITALVQLGLCDHDPVERLIIHDWSDHADDAVHARVARMRAFFANGRAPKITKLTGEERLAASEFYEAAAHNSHSAAGTVITAAETHEQRSSGGTTAGFGSLPEPEPEPEPKTKPSAKASGSSKTFPLSSEVETVLDEVAQRIQGRHPAMRRCGIAVVKKQLRAITREIPLEKRVEVLHQIDQNHSGWCECPEWLKESGQYAKGLENWLAPTIKRWSEFPPSTAGAGGIDSEPPRLMM